MPPKLRDKGKGKKEDTSSKPVKSWYEICAQEENEESSTSSKCSNPELFQDGQDPNEISTQIKRWIESLSQSPELALAFSQTKDDNPFKQIAAQAAKVSKKIERMFYTNQNLSKTFFQKFKL